MPHPFRNNYVDFRGMNRAAADAPFTQLKPRKTKLFQAFDQIAEWNPDIHESAQDHVSADARVTVEMKMRTHESPFFYVFLMGSHLTQGGAERQSARTID
jgi:hypothetical protein